MNERTALRAKSRSVATTAPLLTGLLHRKCACGESSQIKGECAQCQRKRMLGEPVRTRLRINEPGDAYEREADRVAEQVMRMRDDRTESGISPSIFVPRVQRRAHGSNLAGGNVPQLVSDVLNSPGEHLDAETRAFFEPRFGHDFGGVRIHTDAKAAASARAVNALAYTAGRDIVMGTESFSPQSHRGRRLIAHELTHVVQQSGIGPDPSAFRAIPTPEGAEGEIEQATPVVDTARRVSPTNAARAVLQRQMLAEENDATHRRLVEDFRRRHGLPPGGVDEFGEHVGPSDAEIKYRLLPAEALGRDEKTRPDRAEESAENLAPPTPKRCNNRYNFNFHRRGQGRFDAHLAPPDRPGAPCRLTAASKVKFNFPNTRGTWPQGRPASWQRDFIRLVQRHWNYRYLLLPATECPEECCPSVAVRVRIEPVTTGEHHAVNVYYKEPFFGDRSFVRGTSARPGRFYANDIEKSFLSGQTTALHEAGHFFGLSHIRCDSNADKCYGLTAGEADDVMGRGEFVSARDYAPFVEVTNWMTRCDWRTHRTTDRGVPPKWMMFLGFMGAGGGAFLGLAMGGLGLALGLGLAVGAAGAFLGWLADIF